MIFNILGINTLIVAAVGTVAIIQLDRSQKSEVQDKFGTKLEAIAVTAASFISGADVEQISTNRDVQTAAFERIETVLRSVQSVNNLQEDQVYIVRPKIRNNLHTVSFVGMLQDEKFIGDSYVPPAVVLESYKKVWDNLGAQHTSLFSDSNGTFISGLAPITDLEGKVVAILHVDHDVAQYLDVVRARTRIISFLGIGLVQLLLLGATMVTIYFNRRIRDLLRATDAIQKEDYSYQAILKGRDEITAIGNALNQSLDRLKERFEMLKFLPKHTAAMISRTAPLGGSDLKEANRMEVVILETDIRGFTAFSEGKDPKDIIEMLNRFIGLQADSIDRFGGSIDKYMGDAVLAVFAHGDKLTSALECAVDIMKRIDAENQSEGIESRIQVGMGMSVGEVVFGNMGSEQRMEYTIIGSTVNLAARMCSEANASELLISESFRELAEQLQIPTGEPEKIVFKGFKNPVVCYRIPASTAIRGVA